MSTGTRIVLASRNEAKLVELRRILAASGLAVELVGLPPGPDVPETGRTFAENALIKARDAVATTGLPAVADDSGLTVDELNGMPGVRSARWAGSPVGTKGAERDAANNALLLAQLDDVPPDRRGAAFVCAAAFVSPDGREHVVHGELRGLLLTAPRGENGFGYDPLFVGDGETRTTAELSADEKDAISHRGQAFRALAGVLPGLLSPRPAGTTQ
ncbi:RdgB/HAM1 family non-canonical purine NTP pyrophosphatase [Frankia sp. CNm7]|uniref:dITP/XTP pyrophosphatase n=1 Tax=Frankia nepalensis TaxID=1836974 RepID=A0A937RDD9_9ACTN|nr:RdgB/HAM1 family non-canonical purine NTP pyrophosphatase [Frankia nepalensis]MBL7495551.1 RdgB/HAM1 family non-canonical purine NTP pyrophosphatase [Frankia nepalensis]MBL7509832.1 RdgB/HAM1 family non-canonical purine NTP pyrophosphatase [Frankia nepalensis]MBL7517503.1 RdgB/HAM1 family non-canonical purine NTP pyrophosphatase [Frankia nepalensis]MBL7626824.1 RdgB/HAM1 family non-canonical purine NTP pyrophosphatase [Frankia nepalensis]